MCLRGPDIGKYFIIYVSIIWVSDPFQALYKLSLKPAIKSTFCDFRETNLVMTSNRPNTKQMGIKFYCNA